MITQHICQLLSHLPVERRRCAGLIKTLALSYLCAIMVMTLSVTHPADQNCESNLLFFMPPSLVRSGGKGVVAP